MPLIGARVAVKEVGRDVTARPGQIEQGIITTSSASHHPDAIGFMLKQAPTLSLGAISKTLENSRSAGRGDGDFSAVDKMLIDAARRADAGPTGVNDFYTLEYHPARDSTCDDASDPDAWWFTIVAMPYAQRDMAAHAKATGLSFNPGFGTSGPLS